MIKKNYLKFYFYFFILVTLFSCNMEKSTISDTKAKLNDTYSEKETTIPYASKETLAKYDGDNEIISYKIARALGSLELDEGIKNEMGWHSIQFSSLPVIIYGIDSKPLYYEFVVLGEAGQELGTITLYAKKQKSTLIKNVFPYVREYEGLITKNDSYKIFGEGYPRTYYYGIPSKSGEEPSVIIDPQTNESVELQTTESIEMEIFNSMSDQELKSIGIDNRDEQLNEYQMQKAEEAVDADNFWELIESLPFEVSEELTDEKIKELQSESKWWWEPDTSHTIPAYDTQPMKKTIWTGYCGPSAMSWIYRGIYSNYPDNSSFYLPLKGDRNFDIYNYELGKYARINDDDLGEYRSNVTYTKTKKGPKKGEPTNIEASKKMSKTADNSLWYDCAKASGTLANNGWFGGTPTWPWGFSRGIENITRGKYTAEGVPHRHYVVEAIKSNQPVISWDAPDHWVVYYGVSRRRSFSMWIERVKIGWSWVPVVKYEFKVSYKFKLHDNNAVMKGNTEYWEDNKLSLFNINMKVKRR